MTPNSYLISIVELPQQVEGMLAVLNAAGMGRSIYSESSGVTSRSLWIIPKAKSDLQEVTTKLQSAGAIRSAVIIALSNPVKASELPEVRSVYMDIGLDLTNVTDEELSLYINALIRSKYTYYLDFDPKKYGRDSVKVTIRPLVDHPEFSPDWLVSPNQGEEETEDRELTIDDIEIVTETFELSIPLKNKIKKLPKAEGDQPPG